MNRTTPQLKKFFALVKKEGLELLEDDKKYIASMTWGLSNERVRELLRPYIEAWKAGMKLEEQVNKKQNIGRYMANLELREKVKRKI